MENAIKKGFIYIFTNESLKYLKIGKTMLLPEDYAQELSEFEGIPSPFLVAHYRFFNDIDAAEEILHEKFKHLKINDQRDFFNVAIKNAIKIVDRLAFDKLCKDLGKDSVTESDFKRLENEYGYDHIRAEMREQNNIIDNYDVKALRRELKKEKAQHLQLQRVDESKTKDIRRLNNQIIGMTDEVKRKNAQMDKMKYELNCKINELEQLKQHFSENNIDFTVTGLMSESDLEKEFRYTNLKKALRNPSRVFRLEIINSELTEVPAQIAQLKNLQELCLWGNKITVLPEELGELVNMQLLYLSENELKTIPGEIFEMSNLIKLDLKKNSFTNIPPEINRLKKLKVLYLAYNQLTSLPEQIGELTNLEELDLKENPIHQEERDRIRKLLPKTQIRF